MRSIAAAWPLLACTLVLAGPLAACGDARDASAAGRLRIRVPYVLYGVPGPWWRDDASQEDFDRDMWTCRTRSKQARQEATPETRKDVAYRAFLGCMASLAWTRGHPPPVDAEG